MTQIEIPLKFDNFPKQSEELRILKEVNDGRAEAGKLMADERVMDALQKSIEGLRVMREFPDFNNTEFRALLVAVIFDLAEIHFQLKDYKQSEKELDTLFKVLDSLVKNDEERFGKLHILAMELSTRILRSRKKAIDLLVKQQIKVNSGVAAATDRLVDSLSNVAQLLASTGDLKGALKFYSEAIKFSKKRTGRVTRKEIKLTIEMAEIMMRIKQMRPRALRLLNAILPHAIALETLELERDILSLKSLIESEPDNEPKWKNFFHQLTVSAKAKLKKFSKSETAENKGTDKSETQEQEKCE